MSKVSYLYDISNLGVAFMNESFENIKEIIWNEKVKYSYKVPNVNEVYGYHIHRNEPLTNIYGFDFYMVDFIFSDISKVHNDYDYKNIRLMYLHLKEYIKSNKGYYNFRIPTHIVDLIKVHNDTFKENLLCGGIVTYISSKCDNLLKNCNSNSDYKILEADVNYLKKHNEKLKSISAEAFGKYQGQYHISNVTQEKASEIYRDWIDKGFLKDNGEKVIVAEYKNELAGFWTYSQSESSYMTGLTGVGHKYRNLGIYSKMLETALSYAHNNGKFMTIGTQFDNFIVQQVWNKYNMLPFISHYSVHIDARNQ